MNRRNLFTFAVLVGALGMARAQRGVICAGSVEACDPIKWHSVPAKNGQCPVCGTMALVFIQRQNGDYKENPGVMLRVGSSALMRCARCNAAFFVDAE